MKFVLVSISKKVAQSALCQGRSQDFSVGTHSFPSHLFTPPPPKKKIKVIFDSRVFYFKYINVNIFEIYFFIYFFILFISLFIYFFIIIFRYAIAYLRTGSYAPVCVRASSCSDTIRDLLSTLEFLPKVILKKWASVIWVPLCLENCHCSFLLV